MARLPWERPSASDEASDPPKTFSDGETIHYPTASDLAALRPVPRSQEPNVGSFRWICFGLLAVLSTLIVLEAVSGRPPPPKLDPLREKLRRSMGKRF